MVSYRYPVDISFPLPDLGSVLWERRFWILAAAVEKGFTAEEAEPNCDKDLVKTKRARFRVPMGGRSTRADRLRNMYQLQYLKWSLESASTSQRSLICPEMIIEPSVPWYPVENLPFVPKTTDWIAEVTALPPELTLDWQDRYLTGPVPGDSTAAASTVGSGDDDASTPALPPAARSSPPDGEEKESSGDTSLGVLAEAARRLSSD
ncbi:hypothetical protein L917_02362 [Phytophthora nicotianae]|uniref:Uncharacterized protein n=1 Tax=Phytophthora nicotianae TaxID=4792 RepID=W2LU69_PHYNI|nr:hypothetical protein L916_02435 [Phytophthora nicotianae]ETM00993.1 hypothetical protein L917_02362 [Phytophthora nicotianae]